MTTETIQIEKLRKELLAKIEKQLDAIREAAKEDAGEIFEYQTLLWNVKTKLSK